MRTNSFSLYIAIFFFGRILVRQKISLVTLELAKETNKDWTQAVVAYLSENTPQLDDESGWDHMCSSAHQMSCMALEALGYAVAGEHYAYPYVKILPKPPSTPPRWDDICTAILGLAGQCGQLVFRRPDGSMENSFAGSGRLQFRVVGAPPPPLPNILATKGTGPAFATDEVIRILEALGLVQQSRWTEPAETILWRKATREWSIDFKNDDRFLEAVKHAVTSIPQSITTEIEDALMVTDDDVHVAIERMQNWKQEQAERAKRFGREQEVSSPEDFDQVRKNLKANRTHTLDWIFYCNWRLEAGWLDESEIKRRLVIFHDPLAQKMRHEVITQLYPDFASR